MGDLSWFARVSGSELIAGDTSKSAAYTEYRIETVRSERMNEVVVAVTSTRFSKLLALHKKLLTTYPDHMDDLDKLFPKKKAFGTKSSSVVQTREKSFNQYFKQISRVQTVRDCFLFRNLIRYWDGAVYYRTMSVCPTCALVAKRGIVWCAAKITQLDGKIQLIIDCSVHGEWPVTYSESPEFFRRMTEEYIVNKDGHVGLGKIITLDQLRGAKSLAVTHSLVAEVPLFGQGSLFTLNQFDECLQDVAKMRSKANTKQAVRMLVKLAMDIPLLNDRLLECLKLVEGVVPVEMSHDRLIALCRLPNTAFLCGRLIPCIKYYLRRGEEMQCHHDLVEAIAELAYFSEISLHVDLCVERPLPDLTEVIAMLRRHKQIVRVINITMTRPPLSLADCVRESNQSSHFNNVDIYEVVTHLEEITEGEIMPGDFFSPAAAYLLEPLIFALGYGRFCFQVSPIAGCASVLVATEDGSLIPLPRLLNVADFSKAMTPLLKDLETSKYSSTVGLSVLRNAKKLFKQHLKSDAPPSISNLLSIKSNEPILNLVSHSQFLFIRRGMDIGAIDTEHLLHPGEFTETIRKLLTTIR